MTIEKIKDHSQLSCEKTQDLEESFRSFPENQILDLTEFLENFYYDDSPKTLNITPEVAHRDRITLNVKTSKVNGHISFYGEGRWSYNFSGNTEGLNFNYFYDGLGYEMKNKDEKPKFLFLFPPQVDHLLQIPEEYSQNYHPVFKLQKSSRPYQDEITWGWHEDYWDGPLSGFCYQKGKLYRFFLQEEKIYSRERLYAIHELTNWEIFRVNLRHFFWTHPPMFLSKKYKFNFWYKFMGPLTSFKKNYWNGRKKIGYFSN